MELLMLAERLINVDELLYWLGAILTIIAVASAIVMPLRRMLKKYDDKLNESAQFIERQTELNDQYQTLLNESKNERSRLNEDIAAIKTATLTQIKLELNCITGKAIARGYAYPNECDTVELLYEAYVPLGGNSRTQNKVERMRALPACEKKKEE